MVGVGFKLECCGLKFVRFSYTSDNDVNDVFDVIGFIEWYEFMFCA